MDNNTEQKEAEFEAIYYNEIGMCGCGSPEHVKMFLLKLMQNHKDWKAELIDYKTMINNRTQIIKNTDEDVIFEFVFHVLDHAELMEHGGSIGGSWFTEKGERFFELLKEDRAHVFDTENPSQPS